MYTATVFWDQKGLSFLWLLWKQEYNHKQEQDILWRTFKDVACCSEMGCWHQELFSFTATDFCRSKIFSSSKGVLHSITWLLCLSSIHEVAIFSTIQGEWRVESSNIELTKLTGHGFYVESIKSLFPDEKCLENSDYVDKISVYQFSVSNTIVFLNCFNYVLYMLRKYRYA